MKTDKLWINGKIYRNEEADELLESFSARASITGKNYQHMRLLTEETMGMAHHLLKDFEGELWIEKTHNGYDIIFEANLSGTKERQADISASPTGFMAKIAELLNCSYIFENIEEIPETLASAIPDYMSYGFSEADSETAWAGKWSLSAYRQYLLNHSGSDLRLDELEKSIVARLADEVTVGIYGQRIRLMINVLLQK